jgi:hypothetical protein
MRAKAPIMAAIFLAGHAYFTAKSSPSDDSQLMAGQYGRPGDRPRLPCATTTMVCEEHSSLERAAWHKGAEFSGNPRDPKTRT